jgi:hypothetical protein
MNIPSTKGSIIMTIISPRIINEKIDLLNILKNKKLRKKKIKRLEKEIISDKKKLRGFI